jgi:hypothetical protein
MRTITDADQQLLHTAFRQCHADPHFRDRFVTECRKQQETGTDDNDKLDKMMADLGFDDSVEKVPERGAFSQPPEQ